MRKHWVAGAVIAGIVVLAGCAADNANEGGSAVVEAPTAQPAQERVLRIAAPEHESPDLSAEWAYDNQRALVLGNVYERLVTRNPETNALAPMLATSWEQIDDVTWQFKLREGVRFHDGSALTAESAAIALSHVTREDGRLSEFGVKGFSFAPAGEYLLEVTTDGPNPLVLERMYQTQIVSAQQLTQNPSGYVDSPVGTGPYIFTSYAVGDSWELKLNAEWWGLSEPDAVFGAPEWDRVIFDVRPEASTRVAALRAGEVDFAFDVGLEGCAQVGADSCLTWSGNEIVDIRYDSPSSIMGDIRVRRALDLAFDREEIARELYGAGIETTGQVVGPGATGYNPSVRAWAYDPVEARSLIEAARADGIVFNAPINIVAQAGRFERNSEVIQAIQFAWQQNLGIDVTISMLSSDEFGKVYRRQNGPMHESVAPNRNVVIVTTGSDTNLFDIAGYGGSRFLCGGNLSVYCDEEFDAAWQVARTLTGDDRNAAFAELNADQAARHVWGGILRFPTYHAVSTSVNYRQRPDSWVYVNDFTRP